MMLTRTHLRRILPALAVAAAFAGAAPAASAQPLQTSFSDFQAYCCDATKVGITMQHSRDAGAQLARINVSWREIAPATRPDGFNPRNPGDPAYDFALTDMQVRAAAAAGLIPFLAINAAPTWAEGDTGSSDPEGTRRPSAAEFGAFAEAIARRYNGNFGGLPVVRRFQAWNEINLFRFLNPQFVGQPGSGDDGDISPKTKTTAPAIYRQMLNAFSASVHSVNSRNIVITGGMSPFGRYRTRTPAIPPMRFMRELLCMDRRNRPVSGCDPVVFDVWAHHPYSNGNPNQGAEALDNASIPELGAMNRLLRAAVRANHVVSDRSVAFWVTEISWNSRPASPAGLSLSDHARYMSEAMYRIWKGGVSVVTWFGLRDGFNIPPEVYASGVYFRCKDGAHCDTKKPAFTAFRFPFVALPGSRGTAVVWGRTPTSTRGRVTIERRAGGRWRRVTTLSANGSGIFTKRLKIARGSNVRARFGRESSRPFTNKVTPPVRINPLG